jgi:hypothetical protein
MIFVAWPRHPRCAQGMAASQIALVLAATAAAQPVPPSHSQHSRGVARRRSCSMRHDGNRR